MTNFGGCSTRMSSLGFLVAHKRPINGHKLGADHSDHKALGKLTFQTDFLSIDRKHRELRRTEQAGLLGGARREQYTVAGLEVHSFAGAVATTVVQTVREFENHGQGAERVLAGGEHVASDQFERNGIPMTMICRKRVEELEIS